MLPEHIRRAIRSSYPALIIERVISLERRRKIATATAFLAIPFILIIAFDIARGFTPVPIPALQSPWFDVAAQKSTGILFLLLAIELVCIASNAVFFSSYATYDKIFGDETVKKPRAQSDDVRFDVAAVALASSRGDLVRGLAARSVGREIFLRCGIDERSLDEFVRGHEWVNDPAMRIAESPSISTLADVARLVTHDKSLAEFLQRAGVTRETFVAAARWVERRRDADIARRRWWSRERLRSVPSLGEDWSYGGAYALRRFATSMAATPSFAVADLSTPYGKGEEEALERVLSRTAGANAILVGEDSVSMLAAIARLAKKIASGDVAKPLQHKEVLLLNTEALVAAAGEKSTFEQLVMKLLDEAAEAGNIVLLIENFLAFIESTHALGVDVVTLLEPYLRADSIQLLATSYPDTYHAQFATNTALVALFEQVLVTTPGTALTVRLLQDRAVEREAVAPVFYTEQSLEMIASSAQQYFAYGVMPDKAFDLMFEAEASAIDEESPRSVAGGRRCIDRHLVERLITKKTGIPSGAVGGTERNKLLGLKDTLRKRVIGQEVAVEAIGNALLRSRSGIGDKDRPVGTFLFLGPTGVGKTETAKALAAAYFGSESSMLRLDMSEYNTGDALDRLIGSFAENRPGVFATMIREHPYGVLLLDEFEKTTPDVHNLFLQVFDEGMFSDAHGKHVSARNLIIIATSNAGADMVWRSVGRDGKIVGGERALIDAIIGRNIFKPELLNRFDDIVLFRPLDRDALRRIAKLTLEELSDRLQKQGVTLGVSDELVGILAEEGYDPQFGARPMRRAMQEIIEQAVAEKIVAGAVSAGSNVVLTGADLAPYRARARAS
jgi:ATP-dependent Clp protease ATP-binding subunit ClpA